MSQSWRLRFFYFGNLSNCQVIRFPHKPPAWWLRIMGVRPIFSSRSSLSLFHSKIEQGLAARNERVLWQTLWRPGVASRAESSTTGGVFVGGFVGKRRMLNPNLPCFFGMFLLDLSGIEALVTSRRWNLTFF